MIWLLIYGYGVISESMVLCTMEHLVHVPLLEYAACVPSKEHLVHVLGMEHPMYVPSIKCGTPGVLQQI
jgi:hypothetical protein